MKIAWLLLRGLFILLLLLAIKPSKAQSDTSFWFAAPAVTPGHENTPIVIRFATYNQPADISITEPANPTFIPYKLHLNSNSATTVDLTAQINKIENKPVSTVLNLGIKISATATISAYYEAGKSKNPEIFPLKGKVAMGQSFLIPLQNMFDNKSNLKPLPKSGFVIVATEDSTDVTVNLSNPDSLGHAAGVPFVVRLNKGQSYSVTAASLLVTKHLGGSVVSSNKPICVTIFDDSVQVSGHYDLTGDQIVPEANTGNEFIIIKGSLNTVSDPSSDYYFIWAIADTTTITVNGVKVATINRAQCYKGILSDESVYIITSKPAYLLQLTVIEEELTNTSLPGVTCTGSESVSFVRSTSEPFQLNILCKQTEVGNFLLNGVAGIITPSLFKDVPSTNGLWKEARIDTLNLTNLNTLIKAGIATSIVNTSGLFHAGFINGYYKTGARLGYFSNYGIGKLAPSVANNTCINSNIQLHVSQTSNTAYSWTGPNGFTSSIYNPTINNAQPINSGMYRITANHQGCGVFSDSLYIQVYLPANAKFLNDDTICVGKQADLKLQLVGKAPWTFVYSDGTRQDTVKGVTDSIYHLQVSPKRTTHYTISYIKDDTQCMSGNITLTNKGIVVVNPLPTASIAGSDTLCLGLQKKLAVQLTGKAPWTLQYNIGKDTTLLPVINNPSLVLPLAPTVNTVYTISNIVDGNGCKLATPISDSIQVFKRPITNFDCPVGICAKEIVHFIDKTINQDGSTKQWFWHLGDTVNYTTNQSPSKQFLQQQLARISLFTVDNNGCVSDTMVKTLVVYPLPIAKFVIPKSSLCQSQSINFIYQNQANDTIKRWHWSIANIAAIDTIAGETINYTFPKTGIYPIRLMVESKEGCKSDTAIESITINPLPNVGFIAPEICINDAATQFRDTSSISDHSENGFSYRWNFDAASAVPTVPIGSYPFPISSQQKNPVVKYQYTGAYWITDTVISNKGCKAYKTVPFIVNGANPNASFTTLKGKSTSTSVFCSNDTVWLKDASSVNIGAITRLVIYWDAVNSPSSFETFINPSVGGLYPHAYPNYTSTIDTSRIYRIKIIAYSGGVCSSEASQLISVNPSPTLSFSALPPICSNSAALQIQFPTIKELTALPGKYFFSGKGISLDGLFDPEKADIGLNPIQCYYTTNKSGCTDTAYQSISVLQAPQIQLATYLFLKEGDVSIITPTVAIGNNLNYHWQPIDYLSINGNGQTSIRLPMMVAQDSIPYTLIVTDSNGCEASSNTTVFVLHQISIPNAFSPNGDGINDTWIIKNLSNYPLASIQIFDRNGQVIFNRLGYHTPWDGTCNGKPVPVGTYYYIINTGNDGQRISGSVTVIR